MTRKLSFIGIVGLFLLSVIAFAWFMYESHLASTAHQSLMSAESSLSMQQVQLARDKAIVKHTGTTLNQVKTIPQKRDESALIREFSKTAVQTGTQVQTLTFGTNANIGSQNGASKVTNSTSAAKNVVSVQATALGSTNQLLDFINSLQSNTRFAIVNDCDLTVNSSQTQMIVQINFPYAQG